MECLKCGHHLADQNMLATYHQGSNSIHLIIKHEHFADLERNTKIEATKISKIRCNCGADVGKGIPHGPHNIKYYSFGLDKVRLFGQTFAKKDTWGKMTHLHSRLEARTNDNFFGIASVVKEMPKKRSTQKTLPKIQYADSKELDDFKWDDILEEKSPRDYQLKCFIDSLLRDLIVVMPTGSGKTLVASMLLARMSKLNRRHTGLFLVDRIPLVFQQAEAIRNDTSLKVIGLCSENITKQKIQQVVQGQYDVLVITAGALTHQVGALKAMSMEIFHTVVMDECHHATGNHVYVAILDKIKGLSYQNRPRFLGLTASPIQAKNHISAEIQLHNFKSAFPSGTEYLKPIFTQEMAKDTSIKWISVPLDGNQIRLSQEIYEIFKRKVTELKFDLPPSWLENFDMMAHCLPQIYGTLRACAGTRKNWKAADSQLMFNLVKALELVRVLGPKFVLPLLSHFDLHFDLVSLSDVISPRLEALNDQLNLIYQDVDVDQKRILIFVQTRETAEKLHRHIVQEYPKFNAMKVIGKGGFGGMAWDSIGGQQEALESFNCGHSRVLVSTSVLEEGLDIQACEIVINFSQVLNVTRFIQTRGRARKKEGQYIHIIDSSQSSLQHRMANQEQLLEFTIGPNRCPHHPWVKSIFEAIDQNLEEVRATRSQLCMHPSYSSDVGFFLFYQGDPCVEENSVKDSLIHRLQSIENFDVKRIQLVDPTLDQTRGLYSSKECKVFLVGLKNPKQRSPIKLYHTLCSLLDNIYFGKLFANAAFVCLLKQPESIETTSEDADHILKGVQSLSFGHFEDRKTFVSARSFITIKSIEADSGGIRFTAQGYPDQYLYVPKVSTLGFAFCATQEHKFKIIIPLAASPKAVNNLPRIFDPDGTPIPLLSTFLANSFPGKNFVLDLTCTGTPIEWDGIKNILFGPQMFPVKVFDAHFEVKTVVQSTSVDYNLTEIEDVAKDEETFDLLWRIEVLRSSRRILIPKNFTEHVSKKFRDPTLRKVVLKSLDYLNSCRDISFMSDACKVFDRIILDMVKIKGDVEQIFADPAPSHFVKMKSLVWTPARGIFKPEMPVLSNRLTRHFASQKFLVVSFRDEMSGKLQTLNDIKHVQNVIEKGFLIFGRRFYFLCASGSQMREHNCIFVEAKELNHVYGIRNRILTNANEFHSVSKYLARLGLFVTGDVNKGEVRPAAIGVIQDVKAKNGVMLTDGCGKIMRTYADQQLGLESHSDVVQFRFAGSKGILLKVDADDPDFALGGREKQLLLRDSNVKFKTNSLQFGCVRQSKAPGQLNLNREVITLLTSLHRKFDPYLWTLQETALQKFLNRLTHNAEAENALRTIFPSRRINQISKSFNFLDNSWWFNLLCVSYLFDVRLIREKANIPVEEGCRLFGAPDPIGILKPNEIYCSIHRDDDTRGVQIIEGDVLIFRNPCLHPGDLRVVRAVRVLELSGYKNVVLFPSTPECPSSLADECSGGDLDGDEFGIIWDKNLVPARRLVYPPLDYSSLAQNAPNKTPIVNNQFEIAEFYGANMENDALGRVAHMHLALCDFLEKGACDPLAMELAKSQSVAVDFPKTGIVPEVPSEALEMVKNVGFPDFMEKAGKKSYVSEEILGKLFRRVVSLAMESPQLQDLKMDKSSPDPDLILDGYELYMEEADVIFQRYTFDMSCLLQQFGLEFEEEAFLGRALKWHPLLQADKGKAMRTITESVEGLQEKYRRLFYRDLNPTDRQEHLMKTSAWYITSFKLNQEFLSFGWIMEGLLCEIKGSKNIMRRRCQPPLDSAVTESIMDYFEQKQVPLLKESLVMKCQVGMKLKNAIERENLQVVLYGSVSIFVSGVFSDLDVCVIDNTKISDVLQSIIVPAVDSIATEKRVFDSKDQITPFVRCKIPWIGANESQDDPDCIEVDISLNRQGALKTAYIHALYRAKPDLLPALFILVTWARNVGILKSESSDQSLIPTAEFYAFVLLMIDSSLPEVSPDEAQLDDIDQLPIFLDEILERLKRDSTSVGTIVLEFFRKASVKNGCLVYTWPDPVSKVKDGTITFEPATVDLLATESLKTLHQLTLCRNIKVLLSSTNANQEVTFTKTLSVSISTDMRGSISYHSQRFKFLCGLTDIKLEPMTSSEFLKLTARGSRYAISNLKVLLREISSNHWLIQCGRPINKSYRYFMAGSELLLFAKGANGDDLVLDFPNFLGFCHNLHSRYAKVYISAFDTPEEWTMESSMVKNGEFLGERIRRQMATLAGPQKDKLLSNLDISIRLGRFYIIDKQYVLNERSRSITLRELESHIENSRARKNYQRGDFYLREETLENPEDFEKVPLPRKSGKQQPLISQMLVPIKRKSKKDIAASFMTPLSEQNANLNSAKNIDEKVLIKALESCGFEKISSISQGATSERPLFYWKIAILASSGYEIGLSLTKEGKFGNIGERDLNWVHGTIINFGTNENLVDTRINIQTVDPIKPGDDLFRFVFPNNSIPADAIVEDYKGNVRFTDVVSKKAKEGVTFVRRVDKLFVLTDTISRQCDAIVSTGRAYEGCDLKIVRPFCELSLHWSRDELVELIQDGLHYALCQEFAQRLMKRIYEVVNATFPSE